MKNITILIMGMFLTNFGIGQTYTLQKTSGTLHIDEVGKITLIQHDASNIIIERESKNVRTDKRAEGLKAINGLGLNDNTQIGLSLTEEGDVARLRPISLDGGKRYTIKVPKGVSIKYESSSPHHGDFEASGISNSLEVSLNHNDAELSDLTGPLAINTVHGDIDATFKNVNQNESISFYSAHGHVDIAVPNNTKANFELSTSHGEMFTDLDLEIAKTGNMDRISAKKVSGTFNGGGVLFKLRSDHGKIYLRKI